MAKVYKFPTPYRLETQFEELALYTEKTASGELFYAGLLDGKIEVSYDHSGAWHISDIDIKIDNGRMGKNASAKFVNVNGDDNAALYWLLLDRLGDVYATYIQELVSEALAEAA